MKINKYIPLTLFVIGAIIYAVACMLISLELPLGYKILGGVFIGIGLTLVFVSIPLAGKLQKALDAQNAQNTQAKKLVPHAGKITAIRQGDKLNLNIWGEVREIEISSQRILYADGGKALFNEEELAELSAIIESGVINSDEVKSAVLKYVNEVTEIWDDDYFEGKIKSILPPEVEINQLIINNLRADYVTVGFCGEALCDEEHGIAITFKDGKLVDVTSVGDFL